ncbi:hypothetical protein AWENTII_000169 [Aspergillus wentii]
MEEISYVGSQAVRQPLTDATNRFVNCTTPVSGRQEFFDAEEDQLKSPDMMSIDSPLSPKGTVDINYITPIRGTGPQPNLNSGRSVASMASGQMKRKSGVKTHVGPWKLGKTLGQGGMARVRLAKHAITGHTAAVKIISKESAALKQSTSITQMEAIAGHSGATGARSMPRSIEREVAIMKLIEHPNVISLYDVWENRGELYLVLEYVEGGDLFSYIWNNSPLSEEEAVYIFRQIIAGLSYCHRFTICHRDLKPENILVDGCRNVKLADFGMAVLQPAGYRLNTACGSPHYVAPEIVQGGDYQGDLADTWSCGIILYVLLMGELPFNSDDLGVTLSMVKEAPIDIPPELSEEAADLLDRILQRVPERRIRMDEMWNHPLLKKWEKVHQSMSDHYVGPPPPLSPEDCGPPLPSVQSLDHDILRNLQTLFHGMDPRVLLSSLLSPELSYERMFYNALVKFRDEQLENYQGQPLEYSASDYHHKSRLPGRLGKERNMKRRTKHSSLRYSHLATKESSNRRRNSIKEPMSSATVESYDPFRSPRQRLPADEPKCAKITVHRQSPGDSQKGQTEDSGNPSEAVSDEEANEKAEVCLPSSPFAVLRESKPRPGSMNSFHSKMSQASSRRPGHTGPAPRSASYKRNVSFHHVRNRSQGSASVKIRKTPAKHPDRKLPSESTPRLLVESSPLMARQGSPALPAQPTVVRPSGATIKPCTQVKKLRDSEFRWKDEARQVSHELSQICEEAFNGGSFSTACTTSTSAGTETPATSVSLVSADDPQSQVAASNPKGTNTTGVPLKAQNKNIVETRRKIIEQSTKDDSDKIPGYISNVIQQLDRLIDEDKSNQENSVKLNERARPLPDPSQSLDPGYLPIISEELVSPYGSGNDITAKQLEQRAASQAATASNDRDSKTTVRMVPHDSLRSLEAIKPLTIRKKHQNSSPTKKFQDTKKEYKAETNHSEGYSNRFFSGSSRQSYPCELDPIDEHPGSPKRRGTRTSDKKWSWFRHRSQIPGNMSPIEASQVKPIQPSSGTVIVHDVKHEVPPPHQNTGTTNRKSSSEKLKGGLRKIMKRRPSVTVHEEPTEPNFGDNNYLSTDALDSNPIIDTKKNLQKPLPPRPRYDGKNQNLFARVFQIKPASQVLALNASKTEGRQDVYDILCGWKKFGMKKVCMEKGNNFIYGKVGKNNSLHLRPVEFSAEFCTYLAKGHQANLSLVRLRQERGAASSFYKVVEALSNELTRRGILVEDPARAQEMMAQVLAVQ